MLLRIATQGFQYVFFELIQQWAGWLFFSIEIAAQNIHIKLFHNKVQKINRQFAKTAKCEPNTNIRSYFQVFLEIVAFDQRIVKIANVKDANIEG